MIRLFWTLIAPQERDRRLKICWVIFTLVLTNGCAKYSQFQALNLSDPIPTSDDGSDQGSEEPPPGPTPFQFEKLAWETSKNPERKLWSNHAYKVIESDFLTLDQALDTERFCPPYAQLSRYQRVNFWGQLFAAISYYESGWSPVSRMQETTMGTDPITGQPVFSEGLLQLSYQDIQWAPYCEFDWSVDKNLSPTDPRKTILDPFKNLHCGIRIMIDQIAKKKSIVLSSGVYWAVIKENGKYQKIKEIAQITQKLSFCQSP